MNEENNEQQVNKEQESMFKKLIARFHKPKIVLAIAGIAIATSVIVGIAIHNNLKNQNSDANDNNFNIGNIFDGNNNGSNNNNGNNSANNNQNNDFSQYSQLLQNILNNEEYDSLIHQVFHGGGEVFKNGALKPHPYAFLEDQGFDVNKIKSGKMDAYTLSYVLDEDPNSLYMHTRVLVNNSYWQNYLLKYTLTDREMEDYNMLHLVKNSVTNFYVQSVFMNNEISKMKTPEILGTSKIDANSFSKMTTDLQQYHGSDPYSVIMLNPNSNDNTFELIAVPSFYDENNMCFDGSILQNVCWGKIYFNGDVFTDPYLHGAYIYLESSTKECTIYRTQDVKLNQVHCNNFENPTNPY